MSPWPSEEGVAALECLTWYPVSWSWLSGGLDPDLRAVGMLVLPGYMVLFERQLIVEAR
jgi:hypothetical protein